MTTTEQDIGGLDVGQAKKDNPPDPSAKPRQRASRSKTPAVPDLEIRLREFIGRVEYSTVDMPQPDGTSIQVGQVEPIGLAGLVYVFNPTDATIISAHSNNMAKAWANLAKQNERVRRYLEYMMSGGAWGEVMFATLPVVLAIAANHGVVGPTGLLGGPAEEEPLAAEPAPGAGERGTTGPVV